MRSKAPSASRSDAGRPRARSTSSSRRCPPWSRACTGSRRADVRLFLFDVDGTLLTARGAGRAAFKEALKRTFGTAQGLEIGRASCRERGEISGGAVSLKKKKKKGRKKRWQRE